MSFASDIRAFAATIPQRKEGVTNEAATKQTLILPFLTVLGYDVTDNRILSPEYTVKARRQSTKKADFGLRSRGRLVMLIECKPCTQSLNDPHVKQLAGYFKQSSTRLGLLTNGIQYRFYADTEREGTMDATPFLEADLSALTDAALFQLQFFARELFDAKAEFNRAEQLHSEQAGSSLTTEEQRAAFYIIKALIRDHLKPERISINNTKSYCGILIDGDSQKRICLLKFDKTQKQMSLYDKAGKESWVPLVSLDNLHQHKKAFVAMVNRHEGPR